MKKYIGFLIVLSFVLVGVSQVQAEESCMTGDLYSRFTGELCPIVNVNINNNKTSRITYWYGKVNQHTDVNGVWLTDPDGVSGANIDMLTYCKKWYPKTTNVIPFKTETLTTWHERGNINNHTSTRMSYECKSGVVGNDEFKVVSPNGGETFIQGNPIEIFLSGGLSLTKVGLVSPDFNPNIKISDGNDVHWMHVVSNAGLSFVWDGVSFIDNEGNPNPFYADAGNYKIVAIKGESSCYKYKISDCVFDMSDNYFKTISQNSNYYINLISPEPESIFKTGDIVNVKWNSNLPDLNGYGSGWRVKAIVRKDGIVVREFFTPNDGQEVVKIPLNAPSGRYEIEYGSTYDSSGGEHYTKYGSNIFYVNSSISISVSPNEAGYLRRIEASTTMWGSHILTKELTEFCMSLSCPTSSLQTYLVKAKDSSVLERLKQYENSKVNIWGEIKYYNLEGGFWGIIATKVLPISNTVNPTPIVCKDGCVCSGITTICPINPSKDPISRTLKVGTKGEDVKILQTFLGAISDGVFGQKTAEKVRNWQSINGLSADGVVGRVSLEKIIENSIQVRTADSCALGAKYSDKTGQACAVNY